MTWISPSSSSFASRSLRRSFCSTSCRNLSFCDVFSSHIQYTSVLSALFERKKGAGHWFVKTNNPTPITLWKIFLRFLLISVPTSRRKRALAVKFPLNMEKQRFKSCLNLWNAFIEPWSFQKIFGLEKLKTLWNNWLFRQLIHSVQLTCVFTTL